MSCLLETRAVLTWLQFFTFIGWLGCAQLLSKDKTPYGGYQTLFNQETSASLLDV